MAKQKQEEVAATEEEVLIPEIEANEVIKDPKSFEMAIAHAQMEGRDHIEVSEQLFKLLTKKAKTPYITWGKPGIKVFIEGTKEGIEAEESLSAERRYDLMMKRASRGG